MTDQPTVPTGAAEQTATEQPTAPRPTKSAQMLKLLARSRGATLDDMVAVIGQQPHTVRAHLTRVRKAGHILERIERESRPDAYHLIGAKLAEAKPAQSSSTEEA